jgi:hypothetical protein
MDGGLNAAGGGADVRAHAGLEVANLAVAIPLFVSDDQLVAGLAWPRRVKDE